MAAGEVTERAVEVAAEADPAVEEIASVASSGTVPAVAAAAASASPLAVRAAAAQAASAVWAASSAAVAAPLCRWSVRSEEHPRDPRNPTALGPSESKTPNSAQKTRPDLIANTDGRNEANR